MKLKVLILKVIYSFVLACGDLIGHLLSVDVNHAQVMPFSDQESI